MKNPWHRFVAYEKRGHAEYIFRLQLWIPFAPYDPPWTVHPRPDDYAVRQWTLRHAEQEEGNRERARSYADRFRVTGYAS